MAAKEKSRNPGYLYISEHMALSRKPIRGDMFSGAFLSDEREQEIMDILASKGVRTYGQFVKFCMQNGLNDQIPGIEPQAIETMCKLALRGEHLNKECLKKEYDKAQEEIASLKQQLAQRPTEQLAEAAIKEREGPKGEETARSM